MREYIVPIYDDSPNYDEIFVGYIRENAVEVVRCRDCKHFYVGKFANGCFLDHDENVNSLPPDFFCADGERKGEDDDPD